MRGWTRARNWWYLVAMGKHDRLYEHILLRRSDANLQPRDGKGKPYQVRQVRDVILRYSLRLGE